MFFGPKITTVFASRWKALAWSAGVLMTAWCSIPSNDDDGAKNSKIDPAVSVVAGLMGASAASSADSQVSPWALTPKSPAPAKQ
jgi:hypothetical protein